MSKGSRIKSKRKNNSSSHKKINSLSISEKNILIQSDQNISFWFTLISEMYFTFNVMTQTGISDILWNSFLNIGPIAWYILSNNSIIMNSMRINKLTKM
jgi:hypothetical protein